MKTLFLLLALMTLSHAETKKISVSEYTVQVMSNELDTDTASCIADILNDESGYEMDESEAMEACKSGY